MSITIPGTTGEISAERSQPPPISSQIHPQQYQSTKTVYLCYSPDASFSEKRFVLECARQMHNAWIDIWLDRDEPASIGLGMRDLSFITFTYCILLIYLWPQQTIKFILEMLKPLNFSARPGP